MAVVDLQETQTEAQFVRKVLKRFGMGIGDAIERMAKLVRDHKHLENLLVGLDPETRHELYESIRPHLRFIPKPLDSYIAEAKRKAEAEQLPVLNPDGTFREFSPAHDAKSLEKAAEEAIAREMARRSVTLVCAKCSRQQTFPLRLEWKPRQQSL